MEDNKSVLVIGASGVFGLLFCNSLKAQGYRVFAAARNTDAIPASADLRLKLDLEDQGSIDLLADYLKEQNMSLTGIVQAAGAVGFGRIEETATADSNRLMQINHLGPASLISQLLPILQDEGFVIGINGIVSEKTFPGMAAYTASKNANAAFLATLLMELRRKKIRVIDAKPGHTETGLASRALFGTAPAFPQGMTPEHVVAVILQGLAEGKTVISSSEF